MPTPFPYITNVVRVVFRGSRDGNERINTFYYSMDAPPTEASMTALGEYLDDTIGTALSDIICVGTDLLDIQLTDISAAGGLQVTVDWAHAAAGGSQVLPANVALVISKRTAYSGRSNRGRNYVFDLPEDYFNGSTLNPVYAASTVAALCEAIVDDGSPGGVPCVASHTTGDVNPITSAAPNLVAATMKRRLPGHGS